MSVATQSVAHNLAVSVVTFPTCQMAGTLVSTSIYMLYAIYMLLQALDRNDPYKPSPGVLFEVALHAEHFRPQGQRPAASNSNAGGGSCVQLLPLLPLAAHGANPARCVLVDTLQRPVPSDEAPPARVLMPPVQVARSSDASGRATEGSGAAWHEEFALLHALSVLLCPRHEPRPAVGSDLQALWQRVRFSFLLFEFLPSFCA